MTTIQICDADKDIVSALDIYLTSEGYATVKAYDGLECLRLAEREPVDLILLDVMMPKMDGWEVCRKIRAEGNTPVIMLTARGEEYDKLFGFETGIDDYVVTPYSPREHMARVRAVLARSHAAKQGGGDTQQLLKFGGLEMDLAGREVYVDGVMDVNNTREVTFGE